MKTRLTVPDQLRQIQASDIGPGTYDLLERIDCPWIRLARTDEGKVIYDKSSGAPMLANDPPTMVEIGTTLIVLLNLGNPTVLKWITENEIDLVSSRFLQTISNQEVIESQTEIRRILQTNETETQDKAPGASDHAECGYDQGIDESREVDDSTDQPQIDHPTGENQIAICGEEGS